MKSINNVLDERVKFVVVSARDAHSSLALVTLTFISTMSSLYLIIKYVRL